MLVTRVEGGESVGHLIRITVPKINAVVMNESKSGLNGDNHKGVVGSGSCLLLLVEQSVGKFGSGGGVK